MSITAIGFDLELLRWLNENGPGASILGQHRQEPVVESANLDDGDVPTFCGSLLVELGEELGATLRLGRDLATKANVPFFIAKRNGELFCVLVNSEVQHGRGSPRGT